MNLTSEEKQQIYLEEKARIERDEREAKAARLREQEDRRMPIRVKTAGIAFTTVIVLLLYINFVNGRVRDTPSPLAVPVAESVASAAPVQIAPVKKHHLTARERHALAREEARKRQEAADQTVATTSPPPQVPAPASSQVPVPSKEMLDVGTDGVLTDGTNGTILLAVDEKSEGDLTDIYVARDKVGFAQILDQERAYFVPCGTHAKLIGYGSGFMGAAIYHVRVEGGVHDTQDGWTESEWMRKS